MAEIKKGMESQMGELRSLVEELKGYAVTQNIATLRLDRHKPLPGDEAMCLYLAPLVREAKKLTYMLKITPSSGPQVYIKIFNAKPAKGRALPMCLPDELTSEIREGAKINGVEEILEVRMPNDGRLRLVSLHGGVMGLGGEVQMNQSRTVFDAALGAYASALFGTPEIAPLVTALFEVIDRNVAPAPGERSMGLPQELLVELLYNRFVTDELYVAGCQILDGLVEAIRGPAPEPAPSPLLRLELALPSHLSPRAKGARGGDAAHAAMMSRRIGRLINLMQLTSMARHIPALSIEPDDLEPNLLDVEGPLTSRVVSGRLLLDAIIITWATYTGLSYQEVHEVFMGASPRIRSTPLPAIRTHNISSPLRWALCHPARSRMDNKKFLNASTPPALYLHKSFIYPMLSELHRVSIYGRLLSYNESFSQLIAPMLPPAPVAQYRIDDRWFNVRIDPSHFTPVPSWQLLLFMGHQMLATTNSCGSYPYRCGNQRIEGQVGACQIAQDSMPHDLPPTGGKRFQMHLKRHILDALEAPYDIERPAPMPLELDALIVR